MHITLKQHKYNDYFAIFSSITYVLKPLVKGWGLGLVLGYGLLDIFLNVFIVPDDDVSLFGIDITYIMLCMMFKM